MNNIYRYIILSLLSINFLFSYYQVGDIISIEDQLYPLNVCYGEYSNDTLKLADFSNEFNDFANKVIFFRMTATW